MDSGNTTDTLERNGNGVNIHSGYFVKGITNQPIEIHLHDKLAFVILPYEEHELNSEQMKYLAVIQKYADDYKTILIQKR